MPAIRIEGLVKAFGEVRALDGLSLSVEAGSVFGFLGPNGAGKTTTIRILTGLARADSGQAWVDGVEVTAGRLRTAAHVGYLPQDPSFYPWMTGQEMLDHVGRVFGLPAQERKARAKELLELTGMTKAARRRIGGYSGGMRHRLGIAQATMNRPAVLLLDEPVSSLDPVGRKELLELIDRLRGRCTVLMSTHILADVERVCDTVGIIDQGRLVIQAPQQELLERYSSPVFLVETEAEFVPSLHAWAEGLRAVPWVSSVALQAQSVRILVRDLATAKRELAPSALRAGVIFTRYEMGVPSLEEVFMQLVSEGGE
ncbi:MAG TPA: ABC transporter ATP-binding protein [Anaerolineae bacterium]|nr:ABC transporter ATP-binding protein [Anaerolineae bacterium]